MPRSATPMCAEGYVGDGCMKCNEARRPQPSSRGVVTHLAEVELIISFVSIC